MIRASVRMITRSVCLVMLLVPAVLSFDFTQLENAVSEHTLANGLKVIVMERHDAPVVSFVTYANVGSVDDPKGYTGLAHMFEHMAFKGTTTLGTKDYGKEEKLIAAEDSVFMKLRTARDQGRLTDTVKVDSLEKQYEAAREAAYDEVIPNEFGNIIEREGGVGLNAFTSDDETVFFFSLPSNKVELWMALESERFLHPVLREMYKERDVVAEERRMRTDSNPFGKLIEQFVSIAFQAHPYHVPTIGYMSDIQYYSRKEAKAFFEKYYAPANLTVAIVGDVNTDDVIKLAEKYWGRIPYRPAPDRIATVEPEQKGERRVILQDPSQPIFLCGWHIPEATSPDRPALDALSDYLGQGRTSILYKDLIKDKKIAVQVAAFTGYPGDKYPTLMAVYAIPSSGHNNDEVEKEIFAKVEEVKSQQIPDEEVAKIKARAKASFIGQLDTNNGLAMQLAAYETRWGDWHEMFRELDRINAVTAADIQRVANQYLTEENRTVAELNTSGS